MSVPGETQVVWKKKKKTSQNTKVMLTLVTGTTLKNVILVEEFFHVVRDQGSQQAACPSSGIMPLPSPRCEVSHRWRCIKYMSEKQFLTLPVKSET